MSTKIEWADQTWNPVTGCTKVSAGCKHCYAKRMSNRLHGRHGYPEDDPFRVTLHPDRLDEPLRWRKPRRVFAVSMGDLFHEDVPEWFVEDIFAVMACAQSHVFQLLTKRPERMLKLIDRLSRHGRTGYVSTAAADRQAARPYFTRPMSPGDIVNAPWPLPNVWLGVSAEDQATADERIPILLDTPAAVRFVSCEPLLSEIDLQAACTKHCPNGDCFEDKGGSKDRVVIDSEEGGLAVECYCSRLNGLDWVIVGGETGPGARPIHPDWARSLRDQCAEASAPFFFKAWGDWCPVKDFICREKEGNKFLWNTILHSGAEIHHSETGRFRQYVWHFTEHEPKDESEFATYRVGKKAAGRTLDGVIHEEWPA